MKKLLALLLSLAMVLSLAACGSSSGSASSAASEEPASPSDSADASDASEAPAEPDSTEDLASASVPTDSGEPVYGGKATVLYGDELIQYFDPAMGDNRTYSIWLETLFGYDWGANEPENAVSMYVNYTFYDGQIADSYEADYDEGTITVTIRDDVYFQDKSVAGLGDYDIFKARQLTADDVAYSYRRLLGLDGVTATQNTEMPWEMLLPAISSIDVVDDYTVVFHIPGLSEVQLDTFITCPVNITGPEWDELSAEQQNDWHYAVGTGPYILTGFQLDASMTFVKSENYYDYDERNPENKLPYLDEVEFVQIADSANILTQFISGQLDIISFGDDVLSSSEIQQLRDTLGEGNYIEVNYQTASNGITTHYNLSEDAMPLANRDVRIALQHAIDINTITQAVYGIEEATIWGLWADPTGWDSGAMDAAIEAGEYTYDPELATQMLAEAGYPDGFEFDYYMNSNENIALAAQMVKSYLSAVGVTMNIEIVTDNAQLNELIANADAAIAIGGGASQFSLKFAQMQAFPGGRSYSMNIPDEEYIELAAEMGNATSLEDQSACAARLDQIMVEGHYVIQFCGCGQLHQFYSAKMGGVTGEQFCTNNNTRTMIARLWSTTGE